TAYKWRKNNQNPTIAVSAPAPRFGTPTAIDSGTARPGWTALFPLLSALFPDDCSVQRDAPARQTLHYYHSRSSGNPRAHHLRDAPPRSSLVASRTTDRPPPAASPDRDSIPSPARRSPAGGRAR